MAPGITVDDLVSVRGPVWNGTHGALVGKATAVVAGSGTSFICSITVDAPSGLVALTGVVFDITAILVDGINPSAVQYPIDVDMYAPITEARQTAGEDALAGIGGGG
tara:strand:+ start:41081 stop:41401 length:321 start_codon:yes stop_codon:yes gene_type:complete